MEKHKCKLCSRNFTNGKALGGHMKAHLATFPLPPKRQAQPQTIHQLSESASAASSSSEEEEGEYDDQEETIKNSDKGPMNYGLRENPRKSFRFVDPEFSFTAAAADAGSVVQDRESETESRNPTRRRSKRNWKSGFAEKSEIIIKRPKLSSKPSWEREPDPEPEPVSSVSDTSPEENVAMCLMMLSRDKWSRNNYKVEDLEDEEEPEEEEKSTEKESKSKSKSKSKEVVKFNKIRGKYQCEKCKKTFRSHQALGSHRVTHRKITDEGGEKIYECPFCFKVFGSGQALGGHKRSHMMLGPSANNNAAIATTISATATKFRESCSIDLNLPAPVEEDSYSVVSEI